MWTLLVDINCFAFECMGHVDILSVWLLVSYVSHSWLMTCAQVDCYVPGLFPLEPLVFQWAYWHVKNVGCHIDLLVSWQQFVVGACRGQLCYFILQCDNHRFYTCMLSWWLWHGRQGLLLGWLVCIWCWLKLKGPWWHAACSMTCVICDTPCVGYMCTNDLLPA